MAGLRTDGTTDVGEERPFGEVSKGYTPFLDGDVLVAKITPCFQNNKIGQARINHRVGVGSTEFHVIRARPEVVDARYLLHFLRREQVRIEGERRMTGSGGQRRVPAPFLQGLQVPLPPIDEQRRIAKVLDRVEAVHRRCADAVALVDRTIESLFRSQFGAASVSVTVEAVATPEKGSIRTGPFGSQLLHSEFASEGVAVLGIDNVVSNEFGWRERRYVSTDKYAQLKRYTVAPGDVLITIMGTCGRCVVVPDDIPLAINTKHLCAITVDRQAIHPEFLRACFLWHPESRRHLSSHTKGAVMDGLNMGIIKSMPLPLPPLSEQAAFVAKARLIAEQKQAMAERVSRFGQLAKSLQARAFSGQL
ncbi:restriction endonuclease subunit S [Blastococcus saxobsidens]|uniref:Restriction endonuclease subunit S n=2 Tax=Blastococcus saxobsidens TaxID=138336 RepID=A0A6L9W1Z9_9ACTN|nr:restriction endonuclease subunit S [Blastococcus saxobsidens]